MVNTNIPGFFIEEDGHLLGTVLGIPDPDEIVEGIDFDPMHRKWTDIPHPFKGRMSSGGCYLYYSHYECDDMLRPCYIYAGKSIKFARRLWTHWTDGQNISKFFDRVDQGKFRLEIEHSDGSRKTYEPNPMVRAALWFVDDPIKRTRLEHGLIYAFSPAINRG